AAAMWMKWLGFTYVYLTPNGADGGIDIESTQAVAQVKAEVKPTGAPAIRELAGVAAAERKAGLFFALGGYTPQAERFAEQAQVALFVFVLTGSPRPHNSTATGYIDRRL